MQAAWVGLVVREELVVPAEWAVREEPTVPRNYLPAATAGIGSIILNTGGALLIRTAPQRIGLGDPRGAIRSRSGNRVRGNR